MAESPYTYKSPRAICVNCGDRIIKLDEFHDDDWWRHEHNNAHRCAKGNLVFFALPADAKHIGQFRVGERVFWRGQLGECSGIIRDILRPENSGYILRTESDGIETFHPITEVSLSHV